MPVYEYVCKRCLLHVETGSPDAQIHCPNCDPRATKACMRRVYSPPAVLWQGGKPSDEVEA